jgi:hypothetical protein
MSSRNRVLGEELLNIISIIVIKKIVGFSTRSEEDFIKRSSLLREWFDKTIDIMSSILVKKEDDKIYCRLCGSGPFTRKGFYLHLRRIHLEEIKDVLDNEFRLYIYSETKSLYKRS